MGCNIHTRAERCIVGKWHVIPGLSPFDWRSYGMYAFLAGVRNYSGIQPIAPLRGLPSDLALDDDNEWPGDHSYSWLLVSELLKFDYDALMEDRRVTKQISPNVWDGGVIAEVGVGRITTYREFLGKRFFDDLEELKAVGAERIVFGFDN